jgi:hypothetical protein
MEKNKRKHSECYSITFMISTATLTSAGNYDVVISGPSGYAPRHGQQQQY